MLVPIALSASGPTRSFVFAVLLALAVSFSAPSATQRAHANGDSITLLEDRQGRYAVTIGALPEDLAVGFVHITVQPVDSDTAEVVGDAIVEIEANDPEGVPAYRVFAVNTPDAPQYYDANLLIERPGAWVLAITLTSDARGEATFEVPISVRSARLDSGKGGTALWAAMIATIVTGGLYVWYTTRRRRLRCSPPG